MALAKNGFRDFPWYGIQRVVRDGLAKSYPDCAAKKSGCGHRRAYTEADATRLQHPSPRRLVPVSAH